MSISRLGASHLASLLLLALWLSGCGDNRTLCPEHQTECEGICVDTDANRLHCGGCGIECDPGHVCDGAGACELSCQAGLIDCGGTCVDPLTDRDFCGASGDCTGAEAGIACDDGHVCDGAGSCELSCQAGLIDCDGTCIDPLTDRNHCGASGDCADADAGAVCPAGVLCDGAGACALECLAGLIECDGRCIDPLTDRDFCGARDDCAGDNAGQVCADGDVCDGAGACKPSCRTGWIDCGGACVDPATDNVHCGAAGDCTGANAGDTCADGFVCDGAGTCELSCQAGLVACDGVCVDPDTSPAHCGASGDCLGDEAGAICGAGEVCDGAGGCAITCRAGFVECDGTCIDPTTDRDYCGASDDCTGATAGATCDDGFVCGGAGTCELSCQTDLLDCGGTCVDPLTDRDHCGASGDCTGADAGATCDDGFVCGGAGTCELSCQIGLVECDYTCIDPLTDRNHCGASDDCVGANAGATCETGFVCSGDGTCGLTCGAGLIECDGACIDPLTDRNHCGAWGDCTGAQAGTVCAAGSICDGSGACALTCQPGLIECDGTCLDPTTDRNHCGASGNCLGADSGAVCGPGEICDGTGSCSLSCQPGLVDCGGTCIDPLTDRDHCGASGDCTGADAGVPCAEGFVCGGSGTCELSCQDGLLDCGGSCIDPLTDRDFCGASGDCTGLDAGLPCPDGFICDGSGACQLTCQAGLLACDGVCIDPTTNRDYCGASGDCAGANAGTDCPDGTVCDGAGACQTDCQPGLVLCGGLCIDPTTSRTHCGASGDCTGADAGVPCAEGFICNGSGACGLSCQAGLVACDGICVDPTTSRSHCGASGDCTGSNAGVACPDGFLCDGAGACELSCQSGLIDCGGTCVDPQTSRSFCGASGDCTGPNAGVVCDPGFVCDGAGACELSCQSGLIDCGGICVDPTSSPTHCGASGDCSGSNAGVVCAIGTACVGGVCESTGGGGGCSAPLTDCGGTCVDTDFNPYYCGDCGTVCPADHACYEASCVPLCAPGEMNCGGTCADLRTDDDHCGECGNACDPTYACIGSACVPPGCYGFDLLGWSCPTGATEYCHVALDRTDPVQAKEACELCYGTTCYWEDDDCSGPAYGPNPEGAYVCGDGYFGYTDGCGGSAGRIYEICKSWNTYGRWAP